MHGLIFETSIWLLAGSTRFYQKSTTASHRLNVNRCFTKIFTTRWNSTCRSNLCSHRNEKFNAHFWDAVKQTAEVVASIFYSASQMNWHAFSCVVPYAERTNTNSHLAAVKRISLLLFPTLTCRLGRLTFANRYPTRLHQFEACWVVAQQKNSNPSNRSNSNSSIVH